MKRYICLIISLCLVLGSFSFVFASATSWDTSDQANLSNAASRLYYNGYSAAYYLKQIADRVTVLSTISSDISTIKGYLFDNGHSIGYWTSAISSWMSPIYNAILNGVSDTDIEPIIAGLNEVVSSGGSTSYTPYLKFNGKSNAEWLSDIESRFGLKSFPLYFQNNPNTPITYRFYRNHQNLSGTFTAAGSAFAGLYNWLAGINESIPALGVDITSGFNSSQNVINWGSLGTATFTPTSGFDGIYKYLNSIQAPVARLSYVLASDERIAAQEAAALAEQEVVDDFIDPTGDSSATASDFGSISDLSSGYQQNFGSTASVTGLFDIFNSNNFGWFSSETYQQLDTTVAQRGSSFDTPLLDQQLEDISRALGVDYAN